MIIDQHKDFEINSANLKLIRAFAREAISTVPELESTKDDLVLALAEAAQNVVKHAYNGNASTDKMRVHIKYDNKVFTMELFDKGTAVVPENIKPRKLDDIKPGGLGTFFIGQIMDEVIFKTNREDWVNHLILIKKY